MKSILNFLGSWRDAVVYGLVTLLFTNTIAGPVFIPSGSMEPTLLVGDYLVVNRLSYALHVPFTTSTELLRWDSPRPGDIVVFNVPAKLSAGEELYIKRAVAVAGDIIEVRNDRLTVNGKAATYDPLPNGALTESLGTAVPHTVLTGPSPLANFGPYTVPPGHVFVMGDHRNDSLDSRDWGALPLERVRGRAVLRAFGLNKQSPGAGWLR